MDYLYISILILGLLYIMNMRFSRRTEERRCIDRRICVQHTPIERRKNSQDRRRSDRRT